MAQFLILACQLINDHFLAAQAGEGRCCVKANSHLFEKYLLIDLWKTDSIVFIGITEEGLEH